MESTKAMQNLVARDAIKQLRYSYAHTLDDGRWEDWAELFSEDATLEIIRTVPKEGPNSFAMEGREEILEFGSTAIENSFEYSAHMMHNPIIEVTGETANGHWYFDVFSAKPNGYVNWHQGRYVDHYTVENGSWQFNDVLVDVSAESVDTVGYSIDDVEVVGEDHTTVSFPG